MFDKKKKDKIEKHEKWNKSVDVVLNKLGIDDYRSDIIRNILSKKIITKEIDKLDIDKLDIEGDKKDE
jgi:hypothetical protein